MLTLHAFVRLTSVFRALQDLSLASANLTRVQGINVTDLTNLTQVSKTLESKPLPMIQNALEVYFPRIKVLKRAYLLICTSHEGFCWFFSAVRF